MVLLAGLVLIGVCQLRRPFWQRGLALTAIMFLLFIVRMTPYAAPMVVIGSMFMFRVLIYMHELRKRATPCDWTRATAYFFMLPNVCFPLFPLVDYKTFCTSHYKGAAPRIYQTGVR